jgi:hypothetical protein
MSGHSLTADERKERLDQARTALLFADPAAWSEALARLPSTGSKAAELRAQLTRRLRHAQLPLPMPTTHAGPSVHNGEGRPVARPVVEPTTDPPLSARVTGELRYRFSTIEIDSSAVFQVRLVGAEAMILLNSAHPALAEILASHAAEGEPDVHPGFRRLLVAWARLELEGPPGINRERLQQLREDLGRLMRDGAP